MHYALGTLLDRVGYSCRWTHKATKLLFMHCLFTANGVMNGTNLYELTAGTKHMLMHCILHIFQFSCCSCIATTATLKSQPYTNNLFARIASMPSTASPGVQHRSNTKLIACINSFVRIKHASAASRNAASFSTGFQETDWGTNAAASFNVCQAFSCAPRSRSTWACMYYQGLELALI